MSASFTRGKAFRRIFSPAKVCAFNFSVYGSSGAPMPRMRTRKRATRRWISSTNKRRRHLIHLWRGIGVTLCSWPASSWTGSCGPKLIRRISCNKPFSRRTRHEPSFAAMRGAWRLAAEDPLANRRRRSPRGTPRKARRGTRAVAGTSGRELLATHGSLAGSGTALSQSTGGADRAASARGRCLIESARGAA